MTWTEGDPEAARELPELPEIPRTEPRTWWLWTGPGECAGPYTRAELIGLQREAA